MEISQDLQHRPITFIRFNPDSYTNAEGKRITSCWKAGKNGVLSVPSAKTKEWEERINKLKETIRYFIENPTIKTLEIVELFY